jgi:hypothetical protein
MADLYGKGNRVRVVRCSLLAARSRTRAAWTAVLSSVAALHRSPLVVNMAGFAAERRGDTNARSR